MRTYISKKLLMLLIQLQSLATIMIVNLLNKEQAFIIILFIFPVLILKWN